MIKRKYVLLSLLTLVSVVLGGFLYSSMAQAQSTVTGYVSVSAAAFVPMNNTRKVLIKEHLWNYEDAAPDVSFYGSVQLPHGATVTNVTFYWLDGGVDSVVNMKLYRISKGLTIHTMASVPSSSGPPGYGSSYNDTISYATVDNSQYAYYLSVDIPPSAFPHVTYRFEYATIEYTLPSEAAVGGLYIPVDKLNLLSPYVALVSTIILAISVSVAYIKHRKKQ